MRRASSSFVIAGLLCVRAANAEIEEVRLNYESPGADCPTEAELEAEIRARTAKVKFGSSGRRFDVKIERGEVGFVGTLSIFESGAAPSERRIDGNDCVEVASALGLVAALAIDPEAKTAPREELRIVSSEPAPELPESPKRAEPRAETRAPSPVASRASEQEPSRWRWSVGLASSVLSGPASQWLFTLGPEAELVRVSGTTASSFSLALRGAQTGTVGPSDAQASFRFGAARLALAPLGIEDRFRARLALLVDLGLLEAEGKDVAVPQSQTRFYAATGLGAKLGHHLGERVYLDLFAAALANLTRDRFVFETPRTPVYELPFASFDVGISAGYLFP